MINFLTANTGCSSVGGTAIIVSLGVIFTLLAINLYSVVVYRKPVKDIYKAIGFISLIAAIGIILIAGKIIESSDSPILYTIAILSVISTWIWGFSYFGEFWSPEKHGNDLLARNLFAIAGIIAISAQIYSLVKFLELNNPVGISAISANIIVSSILFFAMRDDAQYYFF